MVSIPEIEGGGVLTNRTLQQSIGPWPIKKPYPAKRIRPIPVCRSHGPWGRWRAVPGRFPSPVLSGSGS